MRRPQDYFLPAAEVLTLARHPFRVDPIELFDSGTPGDPDDDVWLKVAKLTASDAACGNQFGASRRLQGMAARRMS